MSPSAEGLARRLTSLRESFDRSFAEPPATPVDTMSDLLGVRLGEAAYAVHLAAMTGLFADRAIAPLPGSPSELLGLAGFRGSVVPVYDLGAVLGHPASAAPRWLFLAAGAPPVALAFDGVDGLLRVGRDSIADDGTGDPAGRERRYTSEVVQAGGSVRPVVDVPAVRGAITALTRAAERNRSR